MIETVLFSAFFFQTGRSGRVLNIRVVLLWVDTIVSYVTSKFLKSSELNSLVSPIEQFSVLMPLQYLLFFLGFTLECELVIIQSPEWFSYI